MQAPSDVPDIGVAAGLVRAVTHDERLPWETMSSLGQLKQQRDMGFMREGVLRMLARDPAARPTLKEVVEQWKRGMQARELAC